jgi:hypothetical protein
MEVSDIVIRISRRDLHGIRRVSLFVSVKYPGMMNETLLKALSAPLTFDQCHYSQRDENHTLA